jgi:pantetheine-phosphate adenylyltransferase
MKKALFPGTFDPPTLGHLEIIQRASYLFETVYVAVADNKSKTSYFTIKERVSFLKKIAVPYKNIEVIEMQGLAVECAADKKADILLRGLRNGTDFDYEYQMAWTNHQMTGIETVFIASSPKFGHLSSTLIREIGSSGRDLKGFVPKVIEEEVFKKLAKKTRDKAVS